MVNAFFKGFFKIIKSILVIFLEPINRLLVNVFPDFAIYVSKFNQILNTYLKPSISYFANLLPPNTRALIVYYLGLLVIIYTISGVIHLILKVIEIIKAIKIW